MIDKLDATFWIFMKKFFLISSLAVAIFMQNSRATGEDACIKAVEAGATALHVSVSLIVAGFGIAVFVWKECVRRECAKNGSAKLLKNR